MQAGRVVTRLGVSVMAAIIMLAAWLTGTSEARTIKHRSWKGYTVCMSHHWKHEHPRRARCHRHRSHEYKVRLKAVRYAKSKLGHWYRWGATGPSVFDCSGLMVAAWRHAGRHLPRTTYGQIAQLRYGHHSRARMGDLLFPHRGHVGMYVGHGRVIHAPHTGARVQYASAHRFRVYRRSPLG